MKPCAVPGCTTAACHSVRVQGPRVPERRDLCDTHAGQFRAGDLDLTVSASTPRPQRCATCPVPATRPCTRCNPRGLLGAAVPRVQVDRVPGLLPRPERSRPSRPILPRHGERDTPRASAPEESHAAPEPSVEPASEPVCPTTSAPPATPKETAVSTTAPTLQALAERVVLTLLTEEPARRDVVLQAMAEVVPDLTAWKRTSRLNELVFTSGLIRRTGRARGVRYHLTPRGRELAERLQAATSQPDDQVEDLAQASAAGPGTPEPLLEGDEQAPPLEATVRTGAPAAPLQDQVGTAPPADAPAAEPIPLRLASRAPEVPADPQLDAKRRERLAELQAYRAHLTVQLEATNGAIHALQEAM